jgi:N-acetylglucosaminyl-diphospho-decaprenol L-rhamnosyltransferase
VTVSVVSHGHEETVQRLMHQLCGDAGLPVAHVVLTHNVAAQAIAVPAGGWPFRFTEVFNETPVGFGVNHNRAFGHCTSELFCVLNPDIELTDPDALARLVQRLAEPDVGCAYPLLVNPDGSRQNEREVTTPMALLRRHLLRRPAQHVDWVNGAFLMVRSSVWRSLGGFDEGFFMYCEDADFCLRLQLAGWRLARADTRALHDAAWASRSVGRPLAWHVRSMLRLWAKPSYRQYLAHARRNRDLQQKARQ